MGESVPRFGCPFERAKNNDLGVSNLLADSEVAATAEHAGKMFKKSSVCVKPKHAKEWRGLQVPLRLDDFSFADDF